MGVIELIKFVVQERISIHFNINYQFSYTDIKYQLSQISKIEDT